MNFGDMQNLVLWRLRQFGSNFGAAPQNTSQSFDPPYAVMLLVNQGYSEFIARTADHPLVAVSCTFPSVANATSYPLQSLPPAANGTTNPAALRVYEMTYTYQNGQEYTVPLVSTDRFRIMSGSYTRRQSYFGPRPMIATKTWNRPQLDVLPGTATSGDTIRLTIAPDPVNSPSAVPASAGGSLGAISDVPLLPSQFHMALVEYAVANAGDAANKVDQQERALKKFEAYITQAMEFADGNGGGDPEQRVEGIFAGQTDAWWL